MESASKYEENARRIGNALEEEFPILKPAGNGCDFRPDGHAEKICGGVMFRTPHLEGFPEYHPDPPIEDGAPIEFKILYGGEEMCRQAVAALSSVGIKPQVRIPGISTICVDGVDVPIRRQTWRIRFDLPQDYQVPCLTAR